MATKQKKPEAGKEMTKSSSTVGSCGCSIWVTVIIVVIVLFVILVMIMVWRMSRPMSYAIKGYYVENQGYNNPQIIYR